MLRSVIRVSRSNPMSASLRANNAGACLARGRLLAFLNNDAAPQPGWLPTVSQAALTALPAPAVEADGWWLDRAEDSREAVRPGPQTVCMSSSGSIIIVSFNSGECLTRCLESIEAHAPAANVVVIDNASTDESTAALAFGATT
jgi:hypothetical protein